MSTKNNRKSEADARASARSKRKEEKAIERRYTGGAWVKEDGAGHAYAMGADGEQIFSIDFTDEWDPAYVRFADGRVLEAGWAGISTTEDCPKCGYCYVDFGILLNEPGEDVNDGHVADFFHDNGKDGDTLVMRVNGDEACDFYENLFPEAA